MATTTHKIDAVRSGSTDREDWDVEYRITFTFWPTERATLTYPGAEPGVEFVTAVWADGTEPLREDELEWCAEWLNDNYDEAVAAALHDREADADDHADYQRRARIEDAMLERVWIK